ncbi:glycosyltransferase [Peribacillus simplex]|uniref:glycosyltransferase n=1 Tax=Peribacillus simplex TaxID=1478 RepID=UPI00285333C3|nr:glycosyltransferase [Peribacillus simplex]MDR4925436.1 glycosyltransferase [Peribacillus simplex]
MGYPRVLVVSNNCFSDTNSNGRTLGNFFINWDKNCLAQFYIKAEVPNSNVCENFFRVTDYEILNGVLRFKPYGRVIKKEEIVLGTNVTNTEIGLEKKINSSKVKKMTSMQTFRELLWYTNKWETKQLYNWIDDFQPEVILFQAGDSAFMYDIARKLSIKYKIPLIIYNSEDYYLKDRKSYSPMFHIQRFLLKRSFEKLMEHSKFVIYLGDLLKDDFEKYFNTPSEAILTASSITPSPSSKGNYIPVISYLGNVGVERWISIVEVGKALQKINPNYFVDVYTQNLPEEVKKVFTKENGVRFKGSIGYDEVVNVMHKSDLLLHVESFSDFIKWDLKHAFSTKIADSLSSGTCLFTYGPEEIASIRYLKEYDAACVVTDKASLECTLREIIYNHELKESIITNALKLAKMRHNAETNTRRFEEIIRNSLKETKVAE